MLENLEQLICTHHLFPKGCRVLCAVSGGADSVCLLHALYHLRTKLNISLAAAHYDHRLRGEQSRQDARFVEQFVSLCCGPQRLPDGTILPAVQLYSGSGDVAGQAGIQGTGIEETARAMRYAFLRETAQKARCDYIATAHNADDNGETILFHLARGSGLRGLTGIQPRAGNLVRPLLTTSRKEIEAYLQFYGLPHREDPSNQDQLYARNRIRHQVTPVLEQLFPGFSARIAQTAHLLRTDEDCLTQLAQAAVQQAVQDHGTLRIPARLIASCHDAVATRAVRLLIGRLRGGDLDCAAAHLRAVVALCRETASPSACLHLPNGLKARREYDLLVLSCGSAPQALSPLVPPMPGAAELGSWRFVCTQEAYQGQPNGPLEFWLSKRAVPSVTLRSRQEQDTLAPPGRPHKSVKKWLIERKIPRLIRDTLPVLDCGGRAVAMARLGQDRDYLPQPGEAAWHIILSQCVS